MKDFIIEQEYLIGCDEVAKTTVPTAEKILFYSDIFLFAAVWFVGNHHRKSSLFN